MFDEINGEWAGELFRLPRRGRKMIVLLFALGNIGVLYLCFRMWRPAQFSLPEDAPERQRLQEFVHRARSVAVIRKAGPALAESIRKMGKNPFGTTEGQEPPKMVVKAILTSGKDGMAVVDIAGEKAGVILRSGDHFGDGRGRILRITDGKVIVRWGGKDWTF